MSTQPKYEIGTHTNRLFATELTGTKKKSNFDGLGNEIVGSIIVLVILYLVVGGLFGKVAGISVTVTIGILLALIVAVCHTPDTVEVKAKFGHDFYRQSVDSRYHVWQMEELLNAALAHPDYRADAEKIIDAGIVGFSAATDADGEIQVSGVLEDAASNIETKMKESQNVSNKNAADATRNYLEGFR